MHYTQKPKTHVPNKNSSGSVSSRSRQLVATAKQRVSLLEQAEIPPALDSLQYGLPLRLTRGPALRALRPGTRHRKGKYCRDRRQLLEGTRAQTLTRLVTHRRRGWRGEPWVRRVAGGRIGNVHAHLVRRGRHRVAVVRGWHSLLLRPRSQRHGTQAAGLLQHGGRTARWFRRP